MNSDRRWHVLCALKNFHQAIQSYSVRFSYDAAERNFLAKDKSGIVWFPRFKRGVKRYRKGIKAACSQVFYSYSLETIEFRPGDYFFDCGANVGELSVYLRNNFPRIHYVAFGSSFEEFRCLVKNAPESKVESIALYSESGVQKFYIDVENADSSLLAPSQYSGTTEVRAITLSEYCALNKIDRIRLLKVEAEGCEPEVLKGASDMLDRIDYVAVDRSCERGPSQAETMTFVINCLVKCGFQIKSIDYKFQRALFVRGDLS